MIVGVLARLSGRRSVCESVCSAACLLACPFCPRRLSVCLSVFLSVFLFVCSAVRLPARFPIFPKVCSNVCICPASFFVAKLSPCLLVRLLPSSVLACRVVILLAAAQLAAPARPFLGAPSRGTEASVLSWAARICVARKMGRVSVPARGPHFPSRLLAGPRFRAPFPVPGFGPR